MGLCVSTNSRRQSTGRVGQGAISDVESQQHRYASFNGYAYWLLSEHGPWGNRPRTVSIHMLDDDSLLHVFYLYRPFLSGEDQDDHDRLLGGNEIETRGRWWYTLVHVCQRWRSIIFRSASYLGVFLVCTYGTPVADMLEHSPPLPLAIHYTTEGREITTDDEQGITFALKQRDRVLRVRLTMPDTSLLEKFIAVMDEEYPILEHLNIGSQIEDVSTILIIPETLQAPHLRLLWLRGFALPMGSLLITTAVSLVTLFLVMVHPSMFFHPNTLLQWISLMPQLERLAIYFDFLIPNRNVEIQLMHTPIIAPVTLPNLRYFQFHGVSTYLEALVHRITTPRLEKLNIEFINQLTFFVPCLLEFLNTTENLRFDSATFGFFDGEVNVALSYRGEAEFAFGLRIYCWHLDWQVSSMAQISNSLSQMFSAVEHLDLIHEVHGRSSEEHNQVDRTEWRKHLGPFTNVKTLSIDNGLVEDLSHCLQLEGGELPLELLPELQELTYSGSAETGDGFTSFIDARQNAGRPVTLVRQLFKPNQHSSGPSFISTVTSAGSKDLEQFR
jgi:hypothetical protein